MKEITLKTFRANFSLNAMGLNLNVASRIFVNYSKNKLL